MAINIKEFRHGNALYSEGEIVFFRGQWLISVINFK